MLRQVYIYKNTDQLYYRHFGKALKPEIFTNIVKDLMEEAFEESSDEIQTHDVYKYKVSYITQKELKLIFLFVTGLTDKKENIEKELKKCKKEFLDLFEDILDHKFDEKTFEVFDPTIDLIHRNLRPKISLVGFSGVGKTTITSLIKAEEIPMQHIPTITGDIATIKIGKLHFHLWDFAGQEQFSYLWSNFIKGSDAVLLITDSTLENVEKSKFFLELIKEQAKNAHTAVIGNKQDLSEALKPDQIEDILGLKTYSMTAIDPNNRDKMIQIIADVLEMNAEVSPDSLSKEFYQKSEKIKQMLSKMGKTPSVEKLEEKEVKAKPLTVEKEEIQTKEKEKIESEEEEEEISELVKPKVEPLPSKPPKPPKLPREEIKEEEEEIKVKTSISEKKIGLKLNPEDFMIKQRPKKI
ncbi:MAG: ADP-ribosylation factor-like protein, partial [Candidatus Lokiarchaeota archaeon]